MPADGELKPSTFQSLPRAPTLAVYVEHNPYLRNSRTRGPFRRAPANPIFAAKKGRHFSAIPAERPAVLLSRKLHRDVEMATTADKRANLDLQTSLLAEHELTKLTATVVAIAERLDIRANDDPEIQEVKKDVALEALLDEIEAQQTELG